ncbi:P-loop containing nucleoside triphosphate hydrolase protein [Calocera viscosa TUFC12733]|uniref:p-loop containing nucleoside triphosphate hydrolase protein n=1 Tax=Calocera viscosa (strain TUFC12733) TaxID=1330018 RepID=A0A167LEC0_CALVF|nr:P-loop containing nucleoside triphosphate hydrolase protein [Calocera viscosa TUFC12733]
MGETVTCPICSTTVPADGINAHLDACCSQTPPKSSRQAATPSSSTSASTSKRPIAPIFFAPKRPASPPPSSAAVTNGHAGPSSPLAKRPRTSSSSATGTVALPASPNRNKGKTTAAHLLAAQPLAERLRPQTLDDFVGQEDVVGRGSLLRGLMEREGSTGVGSCVLWGPPGTGKTTLARILAKSSDAIFKELSATSSGTADVRGIFEEAKNMLKLTGRRTILFVDEIQRFNKPQQDLFLPYVENGWIQLIAATTENPSFKVNGALLSRCRVFILHSLSYDNLLQILRNALSRVRALAASDPSTAPPARDVPEQILERIARLSAGDARTALAALELVLAAPPEVGEESLMESVRRSVVARYDRTGDDRYDLISALHKSLRGSDCDAAMYYLARMLSAGEDPLYVARRLIVVASEDVGLANNDALPLAVATYQACQLIGMPECRINLAHCVAYLAQSPKSTRSYMAYNRAEGAAKDDTTVPVPMNIRNAPTRLMKELGYGQGYLYNPNFAHPVHNNFLPDQFHGSRFLWDEGEGKAWDEEQLREWERVDNEGKEWEGRKERRPIVRAQYDVARGRGEDSQMTLSGGTQDLRYGGSELDGL